MAISAQKLLPSKKSNKLNVSIAKISTQNFSLINPKQLKPLEMPQEENKVSKKLNGIESIIANIRDILKRREKIRKKDIFETQQKSDNEEKLKKEEKLEEKKSGVKSSDKENSLIPNIGIFDRIKNIVGTLFFGWLVNKFFKYTPQILAIVEKFIKTVEKIRTFLKPLTDAIFSGLKFVIVEGGKALAKLTGVKLDDKEKNIFVIINELDKKFRFLDLLMGGMILYDIFDALTEGIGGGEKPAANTPKPRTTPKIKDPTAAGKSAYDDVIKSLRADAKNYGNRKLNWKQVQKIFNDRGVTGLYKAGLSKNEVKMVYTTVHRAESAALNARYNASTYSSRVKERYASRYGQKKANTRFTSEKLLKKQRAIPKLLRGAKSGLYRALPKGLRKGAFKFFGAGAKSLKSASGLLKRIPFIGSLVGLGVDMALGEPFDRALAGAIGAGIGSWVGVPLGSAIFGLLGSVVPGLGTAIGIAIGGGLGAFIGGWIGDFLAKKLYELIKPKFIEIFKKAFPNFDLSDTGKEDASGENASGGNVSGGLTGSSSPLTGDLAAKAKMIYDYIRSKGYSDIHAKGIVANIQRESTFDPGISQKGGGGIGLFQYTNQPRKGDFLKAVPDYKTNWKKQIDYAVTEDRGPEYKKINFSNSAAAAWWWLDKWERSADRPEDQKKNIGHLNSYRFGSGGNLKSGESMVHSSSKPNSSTVATLMQGVTSPTASSTAASSSVMKYQPSYYNTKTYILPINTTLITSSPSGNSGGGAHLVSNQSSTALNTNNVYHMILQQ